MRSFCAFVSSKEIRSSSAGDRGPQRNQKHMAYALPRGKPLSKSVGKIVKRCLYRAKCAMGGKSPDPKEPPVFTARKEIKKLRALLRILGKTGHKKLCRQQTKRLRAAAACLGPGRDDAVQRAAAENLLQKPRRSHSSSTREVPSAGKAAAFVRGSHPKRAIRNLKCVGRELGEIDFDFVTEEGFVAGVKAIYERGRERFQLAQSSSSARTLHRWRRDVKDLWYAWRLIEPWNSRRVGPLLRSAHRLGRALGEHHDLAELETRVDELLPQWSLPERKEVARRAWLRERSLHQSALRVGKSVYRATPKKLEVKLKACFQAREKQG